MSPVNRSGPLHVMGPPGSPYTRKMLAWLRYRHIPYRALWQSHDNPPADLPVPRVKLLPTVFVTEETGEVTALVDTTPIIRTLEARYIGRHTIPDQAVLAFLNDLIEDFADEWLTKPMFHYRWHHADDRANAGAMLAFWPQVTRDDAAARARAQMATDHQVNRLYVVGSNNVTAPIIEASFMRVIKILNDALQPRGFLFGTRPSSADFAIYGQFTQMAGVDPTPTRLVGQSAPRLRAWVDRAEDLSGLDEAATVWSNVAETVALLAPLLEEIGRVYVPFLRANAQALDAGQAQFETEIDGKPWQQPVFPYQAKCYQALRASFSQLDPQSAAQVMDILQPYGIMALFKDY